MSGEPTPELPFGPMQLLVLAIRSGFPTVV